MAKVITSPFISELSGTLGGVIVVNNKNGGSWKPRITPLYVNTLQQSTAKEIVAYVARNWPNTAETTRQAFNRNTTLFPLRSRLGQPHYASGFGLWMRINVTRSQAVLPLGETPPVQVNYPLFSFLGFDFTLTTLRVSFDIIDSSDTWKLFVYVSKPVSPGRKVPASASHRLVGIYDVANSGSIDIYNDWRKATGFPTYAPDFKIGLSAGLFTDAVTVRSARVSHSQVCL